MDKFLSDFVLLLNGNGFCPILQEQDATKPKEMLYRGLIDLFASVMEVYTVSTWDGSYTADLYLGLTLEKAYQASVLTQQEWDERDPGGNYEGNIDFLRDKIWTFVENGFLKC